MTVRRRRLAAGTLVVVGAVLLLAGVVAEYTHVAFVDSGAFADRVVASVRKQPVRDYVAERVARDLIAKGDSRLVAARPLVEAVVGAVAGSSAFRPILHEAAERLHGQLVDNEGQELVINLTDTAVLVANALQPVDPGLAAAVRRRSGSLSISLGRGGVLARVVSAAERVHSLQDVLLPLALVAYLGALAVAAGRRQTFVRSSVSLVAVGLVLYAGVVVAGWAVPLFLPSRLHAAGGAVFASFMDDLRSWGLALVVAGIAVAAVGALWAERLHAGRALDRLWGWLTGADATASRQAIRIPALAGAGAFAIFEPLAAARLVLVVAGAGLVALALGQLADLASALRPSDLQAVRAHAPSRRLALVAGAAAVLAGGGAYLALHTGSEARAANAIAACNGFAVLCDRPVNEVVLVGTHNAMSAADEPGWFRAEQSGGVSAQLKAGVRAFLLDVWVGSRSPNGRVRTDYEASGYADAKRLDEEYGPGTYEGLQSLVGALGVTGSNRRELYLCHIACEAGATPLATTLRAVRSFLVEHPDEVVVIILEDHAPIAEIGAAFARAKLARLAYEPEPGAPWPTLRELIERDRRLIVMAENGHDPAYPWLLRAWDVTEETPYLYTSVEQLTQPRSCRPDRGGTGKPFFLLNNWVQETLPSPRVARTVNGYDFLLARARRCARARGRNPSILAVDFYAQGDPFGVANTLNGLPRDAQPEEGS